MKNLQQIGTGIHEYLQIHRDTFFVACRVPWEEMKRPVEDQTPPLPLVLKNELAGTDAFECPADHLIDDQITDTVGNPLPYDRYYDFEGYAYKGQDGKKGKTSYEWEAQLNGLRLDFKGVRYTWPDGTVTVLNTRTMWMVQDLEAFHGGPKRIGSSNALHMDLHVQSN